MNFVKRVQTELSRKINIEGFHIIAAYDKNTFGIGKDGKIPWKFSEDLQVFKSITLNGVVIMGRKTWDSLRDLNISSLPKRVNIVISRKNNNFEGCLSAFNLDNALDIAKKYKQNIFVIGGEQVYSEAIRRTDCYSLILTEVTQQKKEYDTFFPEILDNYKIKFSENSEKHKELTYNYYENVFDRKSEKNNEENQYLYLLQKILHEGENKMDRTGVGTKSLFGSQMRFSLIKKGENVIPLLTTKKVFWKGIVEELLFFIKGEHDNRKLQAKGVHIWNGNTSGKGKNPLLEEHDLAHAYGVQWRAAGAELEKLEDSYFTYNEKGEKISKGVDQLKEVIRLLKEEPNSRRIIINAWNPCQLATMSLVPCHMVYQFNVSQNDGKKYLSCMMTQRSADMFLGVPFNIASVALFTHILAKTVDMIPKEIIINLGDFHIYNNHLEQVKTQLSRTPMKFPSLEIGRDLSGLEDIEELEFSDFLLKEYNSHPPIRADMAV